MAVHKRLLEFNAFLCNFEENRDIPAKHLIEDIVKIKPSDVISGAMYLKLVSDYREYDRKQKDMIREQTRKIEFLEWQVEDLRTEIEESGTDSHDKLRGKLHNQRLALKSYADVISKLKRDVEMLTQENIELKQKLGKLSDGEGQGVC